MKLKESLFQWYLLKDPSFEGKSTAAGPKVLAYMITEYYCQIATRTLIMRVRQVYNGELHTTRVTSGEADDVDVALYEPVSEATIAAYLL